MPRKGAAMPMTLSFDANQFHHSAQELLEQGEKLSSNLGEEISRFNNLAHEQRLSHMRLSAIAAIGGALGPAITGYAMGSDNNEFWWILVVIGVATVLGSLGSLLSIFRWGSQYGRNLRSAFDLEDVKLRYDALLQEAKTTNDPIQFVTNLKAAIDWASQERRRIKRANSLADADQIAGPTPAPAPALN
jgi:hypothetical protein